MLHSFAVWPCPKVVRGGCFGNPVAYNFGLPSMKYGLLWGMVDGGLLFWAGYLAFQVFWRVGVVEGGVKV